MEGPITAFCIVVTQTKSQQIRTAVLSCGVDQAEGRTILWPEKAVTTAFNRSFELGQDAFTDVEDAWVRLAALKKKIDADLAEQRERLEEAWSNALINLGSFGEWKASQDSL